MHIYLIRHGEAVDSEAGESERADLKRPLSEEGRKKTKRAIRGMCALFPAPDIILASAALRSVQTADLAATQWKCRNVRSESALNPGASVADYASVLNRICSGHASTERLRVAFVTHDPDLGRFLANLLAGSVLCVEGHDGVSLTVRESLSWSLPIKKAGLAVVQFVDGHAELNAFLPPKLLRRVVTG